ncbi:MAG TPA: serine/threonine-protein kinase, partial [Polyangiaceae bacterium]|nr:serine/threonine-protein kinase [Polyangiaceae bacterium]
MTELQSGVLLGRYELLVRIGRGGMASVWVARERSAITGTQRLVAVKAMLPELAAHSEFRAMFLREVQLIQAINHEHVVRVFEVSEDRGVLYMAMEWVEGESLRNVIRAAKTRGALPPEIAVRIAADAAAGLHAAHELRDWSGELRGVVHCDVSPHNILLGINGKAKLVDFGI